MFIGMRISAIIGLAGSVFFMALANSREVEWREDFSSKVAGRWLPSLSPYPSAISERTLPSGEEEVYTNSGFVGPDSVVIGGGIARFVARRITTDTHQEIERLVAQQNRVKPMLPKIEQSLRTAKWTSGVLSTPRTFFRGTYEASISFDPDKSSWPAFWLFSRARKFELDILESPGDRKVHCSAHWNNYNGKASVATEILEPKRWHRYGIIWEADKATCLLDGQAFGTLTYPRGVDGPANLILCLAVGGWAKPSDTLTPSQLKMNVDWVRAKSLDVPVSANSLDARP